MKLQFLHELSIFFLFYVLSFVRCTEQGSFYNTTITLSGEVGTCDSCSSSLLSVSTFGCISSNGENNTLYFEDYLPTTGVVVEYVNISFIATLDCTQNGIEIATVSEVYLTLDGELVGSAIQFEAQTCNSSTCNNCMSQYSVAQQASNIRLGWPNFNYGGQNDIEVIVTSGTVCIRQITVSYYYTWSFQPPVISLISPNLGPVTGGTLILLKGSSFMPGMLCKFGELASAATFIDSSTLYCVSPMTGSVAPVNLTLSLSEGAIFTPISKSGAFKGVSLTNIASSIPNTFFYYENPSVSSFEPAGGIAGTEITVHGSNFTNYTTLSCMIGTTISDAFFISDSSVLCVVPVILNASKVQVGISYNANEYVYATKLFNYQTATNQKSSNFLKSNESWLVIVGCFILFISLVVGIFVWNKKNRSRNGYLPVQSWSAPYANSQSNEEILFSELKFGVKIGRGSAGDVYKATWCGTAVAIKVLPAVQNTDNQRASLKEDQLLKEAALMKSLRHPNVLQFLGACTKPDVCIVTEYMALGSLYQQIHNPKVNWTWSLVKKCAIDATRGLSYLHNCKPSIVHRDLKSHNLLVDRSWKVKVCDFGMSRILDAQRIMTACGTPCWTAPEVLRKQQYNESADVYSLGIVFWELVTREDPYIGMDAYQVVFAVATQGIRPIIPQNCPVAFAQLISECWEEDPQKRPKIDQVLQRLENIEFPVTPSITPPNENNV